MQDFFQPSAKSLRQRRRKGLKYCQLLSVLLFFFPLAIAGQHILSKYSSTVSITIKAFSTFDSSAVKNYAAVLYDSSGTKIDSLVAVDTNAVRFLSVPITGVHSSGESPTGYTVEQNYPNPFNPSSRIKFTVPQAGPVSFKTYTILGQEDASLEMTLEPGNYEVQYAPGGAAGIIFYRLVTKDFSQTKKMVQFGGDKSGKSKLSLVSSSIQSRSQQSSALADLQANKFMVKLQNLPATNPPIVDQTFQIAGLTRDTALSVYVKENLPPTQPSYPDPPDNATGVFTSVVLSWSCTDPENDTLRYDAYFGTDNPPATRVDSSLASASFSKSGLVEATPYYWQIIARDNHCHSTKGAVWRFSTMRATMPHTEIISSPADTLLVLDRVTDTFSGIQFTFGMIDPNSFTKQFSWNVDSVRNPDGTLHWSPWTDSTSARVTAADFAPSLKYDVDHVFSVRSRNEFGSIDTAGFFANIVIGNGNNPQSLTGAIVEGLDNDGPNRPQAGYYILTASAGTNPGTMKYVYNYGPPVDNVSPHTQNIVLHGGIAGLLSVNVQLRPSTLPQSDPVAVIVASAKFHTIYPRFARDSSYHRYLVISGSYDWSPANVSVVHPSRWMIMDFYSSLFGALGKSEVYDVWDMHQKLYEGDMTDFPSLGQLSKYSMIFITADSDTDAAFHAVQGTPLGAYGRSHQTEWGITGSRAALIQSYCYVGGKLVISAKNILGPLNSNAGLWALVHFDTNYMGYFGTDGACGQIYDDFAGAIGDTAAGYPDAVLDHNKLDTMRCSVGALSDVWSIKPIGGGEKIYSYQTSGCDTNMLYGLGITGSQYFNGKTVGTRYKGTTYSVVFYGFPLYYCQYDNAAAILRYTLQDIGEF